MRFLDTTTGQFVEKDPRGTQYAILSHRWDGDSEQTFQELRTIQCRYASKADRSMAHLDWAADDDQLPAKLEAIAHDLHIWNDPNLSQKIRNACAVARKNGFRLIWIDSCCIDKTSSTELSEAINSMYDWYEGADVCFAYLVDVYPHDNHSEDGSLFRKSAWFTRGWTLQELIAPYVVIFLSGDSEWEVIGSKLDLADLIEEITGISADALLHEARLGEFSVAQRLSWASHRETTRIEDRAYSLLGIFGINIPTLYGEGERAFRRLQEAIMTSIPDQSIFAWGSIFPDSEVDGDSSRFECIRSNPDTPILASSPVDFADVGSIKVVSHDLVFHRLGRHNFSDLPAPEYTFTPHGIRAQIPVIPLSVYLPPSTICSGPYAISEWFLAILGCESSHHLGGLLGSVCYIPPSQTGVNVLYQGTIYRSSRSGSEQHGSSFPNLFPLSSETIQLYRDHVVLKVVYLSHSNQALLPDWTLQAATLRRPQGSFNSQISLRLTRKALLALRAEGYEAKVVAPEADSPAADHIVTLSLADHTVTATYSYTRAQEGFNIVGSVITSRYENQATSESASKPGYAFLEYNNAPTKALFSQEAKIVTSDGSRRSVALVLNFASKSSFTLDVDLEELRQDNLIARRPLVAPRSHQPARTPAHGRLDMIEAIMAPAQDTLSEELPASVGPSIPQQSGQSAPVQGLLDYLHAIEGYNDSLVSVNPVHDMAQWDGTFTEFHKLISTIADDIKSLLRVLDDISKINPFIMTVVNAFRVAFALDQKRRYNNNKISLMFVEMRDMMAVLVQLKNIKDYTSIGAANATLSESMQDLVDQMTQDIRRCANMCDAYAKKTLLSKVMHNSSWNEEFKVCIKGFRNRRFQFELALSTYIGQTVENANDKPATIEEKIDRIFYCVDASMTPEEQEVKKFVDEHGGPDAVMRYENLLHELFESHLSGAGAAISDGKTRHRGVGVDEFKQLQKELRKDVQTTVRENTEQFEAKFTIQQCELKEDLRRETLREGTRIIDVILSGPHDKILDPDIYQIWKEMNWRGSVKDRHFVLTLRDHFREKLERISRWDRDDPMLNVTLDLQSGDEWTLECITVTRVQPIIEALDDDVSGFITVAQVNAFTMARPANWSLPHWLAYWAIGHQISMSDYAAKIDVLLAKMFSLKAHVLPANRNAMERYLLTVWTRVTMLTTAFRRVAVDEQLLRRFEDYTQTEEERLLENLMSVKYDIDGQDTLDLIRGPGRIEKDVLPLLYLLLKRDFEIMRLARTQYLHVDELYDSMCTFLCVFSAVNVRYDDLADLFKHQKLDPAQQFRIFAFELFKYWHDEEEIWSVKKLKEATFLEVPYDDSIEAQGVDPANLINHPLRPPEEEELFHENQFVETEVDKQADPALRKILGHWSGFLAQGDLYPSQSMVALDIHVSVTDSAEFYCKGVAPNGTDWNLTGQYTTSEDGTTRYAFSISYAARFPTQFFSGELDEIGMTLSGSWGFEDSKPFTFIFKRLSSGTMRFYPTPSELAANKPRALWQFAISATTSKVRWNMGSWDWLRKRSQTGKRYAELVIHSTISPLTTEETAELSRCQRTLTPDDARLYQILRNRHERSIPVHWGVYCDVCGEADIRGSRIVCVSCGMKATVDLCSKEECLMSEVRLDVRDDLVSPHLPSHDLLKLRTAIHPYREFGQVYRNAQFALKTVRQRFIELALSGGQSKSKVQKQPPTCINCGDPTSPPCWYCIECQEDTFVCVSCDTKQGGINCGGHQKTHALVLCQSIGVGFDVETERSALLNARINLLETKLTAVEEDRLKGVNPEIQSVMQGLSEQMTSLGERLQRIEDLLLDLRVGQRASVSGPEDEAAEHINDVVPKA